MRIGVIGLGWFGEVHCDAIRATPGLELAGLCTRTGSRLEALGRNPDAAPVIQTNMILGIAFTEAIAIYSLVVAVMVGFVF